MTVANNIPSEEFLSGKLAHVNIAGIERELRMLWKQAAHGDPNAGQGDVTRACSFTLILFTNDDDAETTGNDLLADLATHHACRGILSIYRPDKDHHLEAWVSARCHRNGKNKQICSEQITVCCDGGRPQELASVVLPLVLPDLPVFVWWHRARLDWSALAELVGTADRLVLDSAWQPFDLEYLSEADRLIAENKDTLRVSDLNWRRIHGWCRSVADSFDGFPFATEELWDMKRVTISFSGQSHASTQTLLFLGWLASRLNWQPLSYSGTAAGTTFKTPKGTVEVSFVADPKTGDTGEITQLQVEFNDKRTLQVGLEKCGDAYHVVSRECGCQKQETTRISHDLSEAVLVGQELEVLSSDVVYEASMSMAANLLTLRR